MTFSKQQIINENLIWDEEIVDFALTKASNSSHSNTVINNNLEAKIIIDFSIFFRVHHTLLLIQRKWGGGGGVSKKKKEVGKFFEEEKEKGEASGD